MRNSVFKSWIGRENVVAGQVGVVKLSLSRYHSVRIRNQVRFQNVSFREGAHKTNEVVSICLLLSELSDYNPASFL